MNEFFSHLYEALYYASGFSDELIAQRLYAPMGITACVSGILAGILFYYVINRPSFSRWYHWASVMGGNFLLNGIIGRFWPQPQLETIGLHYSTEYYLIGLANGAVSSIAYILFMLFFRWFSTNARQTPIPH